MRCILLLLTLMASGWCVGQTRNPALDINRANVWRFGDASIPGANDVPGLDFNTGTPVVTNSGKHTLFSTTSAVSDLSGSLQLYGSEQSLYDRTEDFLANAGVVGDSGWTGHPRHLAVPMPKSQNIIYCFTAHVTLKYTVVDMNLNNGKGQATIRNVQLQPYPTEPKIAAVHHCNGSDVWITGHRWFTDTFYSYLLTDTGIVQPPVYTKIAPIANVQGYYQGGSLKFSPNGSKLAIAFHGNQVPPYLYDFDKSTGIVSNPTPLQLDIGAQGLSFSPDNSKLYVSTNNGLIVQYDLNASDLFNSRKVVIDVFTSFSNLQQGRDGRIYAVAGGPPHYEYLTVINAPNKLDTLCQPQLDAIFLNGGKGVGGSFMNTVESYFYTGSSANPCYGDTTISNSDNSNSVGILALAYPNPFSDYTVIDLIGVNTSEEPEYQLCDVSGRLCEANIIEHHNVWIGKRIVLNKGRLSKGVYFLTVKAQHQSTTIKLSIL